MTHTVRRVLPHEYTKYRQHLKALDRDSQVLRFGYPIREEMIDEFCNTIENDKDHHILFCVENSQLEFIGIGHIALGDTMELAFSVLKEHQGQGVGTLLMKRCIQWCRTHNVLDGMMVCLTTNGAIRHLCSKYGIRMENDHGETLASVHLDKADSTTYVEEAIDSNRAIADWLTKRALLPLAMQTRLLAVL